MEIIKITDPAAFETLIEKGKLQFLAAPENLNKHGLNRSGRTFPGLAKHQILT